MAIKTQDFFALENAAKLLWIMQQCHVNLGHFRGKLHETFHGLSIVCDKETCHHNVAIVTKSWLYFTSSDNNIETKVCELDTLILVFYTV